jgi:hypothetical protein
MRARPVAVLSEIDVDDGLNRESLPWATVPAVVPYATPRVVRAVAASAAVKTARPVLVLSVMLVDDTDCTALSALPSEVCTADVRSVDGIPLPGLT